jgi:hypothetical protein
MAGLFQLERRGILTKSHVCPKRTHSAEASHALAIDYRGDYQEGRR